MTWLGKTINPADSEPGSRRTFLLKRGWLITIFSSRKRNVVLLKWYGKHRANDPYYYLRLESFDLMRM